MVTVPLRVISQGYGRQPLREIGRGHRFQRRGRAGSLVYAMRITETMSFERYWRDPRFRAKRPCHTEDLAWACGDNIYYRDPLTGQLEQVSHAYHECTNMETDTMVDRVLISEDFLYWGCDGPPLPPQFAELLCRVQGHKCRFPQHLVNSFVKGIHNLGDKGCQGEPTEWHRPPPRKRTCG